MSEWDPGDRDLQAITNRGRTQRRAEAIEQAASELVADLATELTQAYQESGWLKKDNHALRERIVELNTDRDRLREALLDCISALNWLPTNEGPIRQIGRAHV